MTGRYPHNTGAAELHTEPSIDFSTIGSELKLNGYYTGQAGKWHMGEKIKNGFDLIQTDRKKNGDGGEEYWVEGIQKRDKTKPFFFWYAAHDAHRKWGPNEFSGTHSADKIVPPITLLDGPETKLDLAKYYDEVKRFDHYIGKVEEELRKQGESDNTVLIIMADNGRPFPRDKTRVYNSGMKTPFIVKWPNGIKSKGTVSNSLISSIDLGPTILQLGNIEAPESFQGQSFMSILKSPEKPFRKYAFAEHNWHDSEAHERMVRNSDYMYVFNSRPQFSNQGPADALVSPTFKELVQGRENQKLSLAQSDIFLAPRPAEELFDCRKDSLQLNNLISNDDYETVHKELKNVLINWMEQTGDNVPKNLTKDWYSRTTGKRIEEAMNIRGEMPGVANNADKINESGGF